MAQSTKHVCIYGHVAHRTCQFKFAKRVCYSYSEAENVYSQSVPENLRNKIALESYHLTKTSMMYANMAANEHLNHKQCPTTYGHLSYDHYVYVFMDFHFSDILFSPIVCSIFSHDT